MERFEAFVETYPSRLEKFFIVRGADVVDMNSTYGEHDVSKRNRSRLRTRAAQHRISTLLSRLACESAKPVGGRGSVVVEEAKGRCEFCSPKRI